MIYKYVLSTPDGGVPMPEGAEILSAGVDPADGGSLVVWADVDPAAPTRTRDLRAVNTGMPAPGRSGDRRFVPLRFIGTVIVQADFAVDSPIVWHLFDGGER